MSIQWYRLGIVASIVLLIVTGLHADGPDTLWTRTYGGPDQDRGYSVCETFDGCFAIAGYTRHPDSLYEDVYLVKTDPDGDTLWTRAYGGSSVDIGRSLRETSDGGYIIGGYTYSSGKGMADVYLVKTDADGDTLWTGVYGDIKEDQAWSVRQTFPDDGYIVAGHSYPSGGGRADAYLVKTDSDGQELWSRAYGDSMDDAAFAVAQTSDTGYVAVGYVWGRGLGRYNVWLLKTDAWGDTLWTRVYGGGDDDLGFSVQQTSDGGYIIAGSTYPVGSGNWDVYLVKTDAAGDTLWTRTYGGAGDEDGRAVQQTMDGGYIVAGYSESFGAGDSDVYIIKTNADGDTLWTRVYGDTSESRVYSVQETTDGGYIVGGHIGADATSPHDVYLIRMGTDLSGAYGSKISDGRALLSICGPNPFREACSFEYHVGADTYVRIMVYNALGQRVVTLMNGDRQAGRHGLVWDGQNSRGEAVSSGVYMLGIETGGRQAAKKILVIR